MRVSLSFLCVLALVACGDDDRPPVRDGGGGGDAGSRDSSVPRDVPFSCTPGQFDCAGNVYFQCGDDGMTRTNETVCDDACDPELRCVLCRPGTRRCTGNVSEICASNGLAWITGRNCDEWGSTCAPSGFCGDACGEAESSASNIGCEYWPTPLANIGELDRALFDYRVVVSNPNSAAANVEVTRAGASVTTVAVPANGVSEIPLPWIDAQSFGFGTNAWSSLTTADGAYRLTSDLPVTVSQFNPFEYNVSGTFSFTNDATLLLPAHVLTGDYIATSYVPLSRATGMRGGPIGGSSNQLKTPGYVAVVGITPEPTNVEMFLTANVAADSAGRWPAATRGTSISFTLQRGEVAHVAAAVPPDCAPGRPGYNSVVDANPIGESFFDTCQENEFDLTGTRITASQPVEVFGGHVCAYVPFQSQACDHLETQLAPIQTWGTEFVSTPMIDSPMPRQNLVRVVAAFTPTNVVVDPPQGGFSAAALSQGQWVEFLADGPFRVSSDSAIQVSQLLLGQNYTMPEANRGDPAMTILVPREQWRSDYSFAAPTSYNAGTNGQSFLLITRPPGLDIQLDGASVAPSWQSVGGLEVGIVPIEGGIHTLRSTDTFGVIQYGLGTFTSYAYPAGLNLEQIVVLI
ncbi:MAG: IgGFc-binding protein [Myxococcota bacterium]